MTQTHDNRLRLQSFMARCGIASRRKCEEYIRDGRVIVNGRIVAAMGTTVALGDEVLFDGRRISVVLRKVYLALHKPAFVLCSNSDPQGRALAKEFFLGADLPRLFHVGRLDFLSSGLVFYTNDGEFSRILTHPSYGIEKEYCVDTASPVPPGFLEQFKRGLTIDGIHYTLAGYTMVSRLRMNLTLIEGKNREIRKVFAWFGISLKRVHRTKIGPVSIRGIPPGRFRYLSQREVSWFMKRSKEQSKHQ